MKKVVLNSKKDGCFDLSPIAVFEYLKLKGKTPYFYYLTKDPLAVSGISKERILKKINLENIANNDNFYVALYDMGDETTFGKISLLSSDQYFARKDISDRYDKDLINVVESLGCEKASGFHANLRIEEIPDDKNYPYILGSNHSGVGGYEFLAEHNYR